MDLINDYRTRPAPMSTQTYFEERRQLAIRAKMLLEIAEKLRKNYESV